MSIIRFFHGTSTTHLDAIKRQGLKGSPPQRVFEGDATPMKDHVYLTTSVTTAMSYALHATAKFGGDVLLAVVDLDRNDPRLAGDEDMLLPIQAAVARAGILDMDGGQRSVPWDIADYIADYSRVPYGVSVGSAEHLQLSGALVSAAYDQGNLAAFIRAAETWKKTRPDRVTQMQLENDPAEYPQYIQKNLKAAAKGFAEALAGLWPGKSAPPPRDRLLEFCSSRVIPELANAAASSGGVLLKAWLMHRDAWSRQFPEWFSALAGIDSGSLPTVMVQATHLRPTELWVIPKGERVSSYGEVKSKGERVKTATRLATILAAEGLRARTGTLNYSYPDRQVTQAASALAQVLRRGFPPEYDPKTNALHYGRATYVRFLPNGKVYVAPSVADTMARLMRWSEVGQEGSWVVLQS